MSWSANVRLNEHGQNWQGTVPAIAVGATGLYVAWDHARPNEGWPDILLVRSEDGGETWGPNVWVAQLDRNQEDPSIAIDGRGKVYAAWVDTRNSYIDPESGTETGNPDIYFTSCEAPGRPQAEGVRRPITVGPIDVSLGAGDVPADPPETPSSSEEAPRVSPAAPMGRRGCRMEEEPAVQENRGSLSVATNPVPEPSTPVVPVPTPRSEGCRSLGLLVLLGGAFVGFGLWNRMTRRS
jgi:hypothetical protein